MFSCRKYFLLLAVWPGCLFATNSEVAITSAEMAKTYEIVVRHVANDWVFKIFRIMEPGDCHYLDTEPVCKRQQDAIVLYRYEDEADARVFRLGHSYGRNILDAWMTGESACLALVERVPKETELTQEAVEMFPDDVWLNVKKEKCVKLP